MKTPNHPVVAQTRMLFRIVAGALAVAFVLGAFPLAMLEMERGGQLGWVFAICNLWAGIGFGVGAWTGRWPGAH